MEFVRNLYTNADEDKLGKIGWYIRQSNIIEPVMCIKKYDTYQWELLDELSAANWRQYRSHFSQSCKHSFALIANQKLSEKMPECSDVLISLIKTLTPKQRNEWLEANPTYKKKFCVDCGEFNSEIKKCVHSDCPGMCAKCFDKKNKEGFETCACCHKKQELTCPICFADHPVENMVKSETCCHHVCWKCFGLSVKSTRPLADCPMCRARFCYNLVTTADSDDDMSDYEDDDDEMPELEHTAPDALFGIDLLSMGNYINHDDNWIQEALLRFAQHESQVAINNELGLLV